MLDKKNILKIGYFADGPWSHRAFELLNKDPSIKIKFIVPRSDTKDQTLKKYSEKYNIPYLQNVNINSESFYNQVIAFECHLFVSMSFNQIFKKRIMNLPVLKTINCHAGMLPFYRGRNILNWVLINDEREYGITVHYIDEGIDTGDIILQRKFEITDNDSYNTLLTRAFDDCALILYDAIKIIQDGQIQRVKQEDIHPIGLYCGRRQEGDELIDWNQTSREIFNFIRAIDSPGPQARTYINGEELKINSSALIENAPEYKSTVGQVLLKTDSGFIVKTKDTFIEIREITTNAKIKVGDRCNSKMQI